MGWTLIRASYSGGLSLELGIVLALKRARRTGSKSAKLKVQGEGTCIMDARRASMQIFLKVFHFSLSIFSIKKLDKYIKEVIRHRYNY